ncbi:MAG: DUF2269 domain-containing protein [Gemmatimonadales bacterium]
MRAAWIAMELTGWFVIVPLAIASLLTGVVMALGTQWGLFRHYWVLFSFVLTVFATTILLLHMPTVSHSARVAAEAESASLRGLGSDLLHPGLGLVVLLVIQVLNVYKPRGMTPYGRRKLTQGESDPGRTTSPPRWVYVSGIVAIGLALAFLVLHAVGRGLGGH